MGKWDLQKKNLQLIKFTSIIGWFGGLCSYILRWAYFTRCVRFAPNEYCFNWIKSRKKKLWMRNCDQQTKWEEMTWKWNREPKRILMCPHHEPTCLNYIKFVKVFVWNSGLNFIKCSTVRTRKPILMLFLKSTHYVYFVHF